MMQYDHFGDPLFVHYVRPLASLALAALPEPSPLTPAFDSGPKEPPQADSKRRPARFFLGTDQACVLFFLWREREKEILRLTLPDRPLPARRAAPLSRAQGRAGDQKERADAGGRQERGRRRLARL